MNVLGVWGPTGGRGLAVEGPGVCSAGSCVPRGLLAFAEAAAAVGALEASGTKGVVLSDVLLLGAWVWGLLRAAVEDGAGPGGVEEGGVGCPEAGRSGPPATVAGVPTSVLCALPAVTARGLRLAPRAPAAAGSGEGGVVCADVVVKALSAASLGAPSGTTLSPVRLRAGDPESWAATRCPDKDKEETQASTRAVHILRVRRGEAGAVPEAPGRLLSGCAQCPRLG